MAVKIIKYSVRANGKQHFPPTILDGLPKDEEARLVSQGFCEFIEEKANIKASDSTGQDDKTGYSSLKVKELQNLCDERMIEFDEKAKKADLIKLIEEADKSKEADEAVEDADENDLNPEKEE